MNDKKRKQILIHLDDEQFKAIDQAYKKFIANLKPSESTITKTAFIRMILMDKCRVK